MSVNEHFPPLTVYVYEPAPSVWSRVTTLAPLAYAPFDSPSISELHFEKDSFASASPEPADTVNDRDGFCGFSELENVVVTLVGCVIGAAATTPVGVELAGEDPPALDAVTTTRRVEPTAADGRR